MASESNGPIFPEEDFEIVEVDCFQYLTEEQKKWPVLQWTQNEEFAIEEPVPSLVLNFDAPPTPNGLTSTTPDPIPTLLNCISEYEKGIGGNGLHFTQEASAEGHVRFRGSPLVLEGARNRLHKVAEFVSLISAANAAADVA